MTAGRHTRRRLLAALLLGAALVAAAAAWKGRRFVEVFFLTELKVVTLASGLDTPWSLVFLPDGDLLVGERPGRLRRIARDGRVGAPVDGLPAVWPRGGLMGLALSPDADPWLYWSWMEPSADGSMGRNAVARGKLRGNRLESVEVIFRDPQFDIDRGSFGSRLAFGPDGHLYVTLGDRSRREQVQRLDSYLGKVLRLRPDGSVPPDNPFVGRPGALGEIWALGFRDPQGIAFDAALGAAWVSDHGPLGGDEINLVRAGANHGWPVVTYGCEEETCAPVGEGRDKPGMAPAALWWGEDVAVPPSAVLRLDSERYPEWRGQVLVGTLHGQALMRMTVDGERLVSPTPLFAGRAQRTRDVQQGPDGWLYLVTNAPDGRVLRLER